jgi:hypothetical protein
MTTTLIRDNAIMPVGTPPYCSACGRCDSEGQYVDFDAACDRGYGEDPSNPDVKVAMEYLILCEQCISEGARHIGMIKDDDGERIAVLERRLEEEKVRADKYGRYAQRLEITLRERPEPIEMPSRPRGRPASSEANSDEHAGSTRQPETVGA